MSKKETKKEESFNLDDAIWTIHPLHRDDFYKYCLDKKVKSKKEFDKLYKQYGELG